MRTWSPRSRKEAGRSDPGDPPNDVFEQPERSLLGEALNRPVGLFSAILLVGSAAVFLANHLFLAIDRLNDFSLAGLFLGGGVLVSMLLKSGDVGEATPRRSGNSLKTEAASVDDSEVILEDMVTFDQPESETATPGLAEVPAAGTPRLQIEKPKPRAVPKPVQSKPLAIAPEKSSGLADDGGDDELQGLQKGLIHYVEANDHHGQGEVLRRLGHLAKSRGHLRESQEFYMKSRDCFQVIGDHYAEAAVLLDLGQVLESLDEHDSASAAYRDANRALLDVAMNSGDRHNEVQANAAD